jgi:hypothetical protein
MDGGKSARRHGLAAVKLGNGSVKRPDAHATGLLTFVFCPLLAQSLFAMLDTISIF